MTIRTHTQSARSPDAETAEPRTPDVVEVVVDADEATVMPVGTFAAGQSADGRYLAVTAASQGTFARGQADVDPVVTTAGEPSAHQHRH